MIHPINIYYQLVLKQRKYTRNEPSLARTLFTIITNNAWVYFQPKICNL